MQSLPQLDLATNEFFSLHWPESWGQAPGWSSRWDMQTGILNPKLPGTYALSNASGTLLYVGKGSQKADAGIARRLLNHVVRPIKSRGPYVLVDNWSIRGVDTIHTLGFLPAHAYMIPALESFLIDRLKPKYNVRL